MKSKTEHKILINFETFLCVGNFFSYLEKIDQGSSLRLYDRSQNSGIIEIVHGLVY